MNYLFICLSFRSFTRVHPHTETLLFWNSHSFVSTIIQQHILYAYKKRMYLSNGGTPSRGDKKHKHTQFQTYPERLPLGSVPFQCIAQQLQPIEQVIQYLSTFYSKHRTFYEPTFCHKPIRRALL